MGRKKSGMRASQIDRNRHTKVSRALFPKSFSSGSHFALMISPVAERMTVCRTVTIFPIVLSIVFISIIFFLPLSLLIVTLYGSIALLNSRSGAAYFFCFFPRFKKSGGDREDKGLPRGTEKFLTVYFRQKFFAPYLRKTKFLVFAFFISFIFSIICKILCHFPSQIFHSHFP